jgi:omega-amidase
MQNQPIPNLKAALIQTKLHWKSSGANLAMLEEKIWTISDKVDLIVLPEMFSTGFTMDAEEMAEPMNFTACKWMKQMASQTGSVVTGSVIIKENGNFFNRLLWITPEGAVSWYDKRHLFRMANEDRHYSAGTSRKIFELNGWKILPQVCYDLRFPVWSRNKMSEERMEYDLVFYVANWPAPRTSAWDVLLQARAVENLSYCVGVNRVGKDGNDILYSGHSAAYDYKGERLAFSEEEEKVLVVDLEYQALETYRNKFPAWMDADSFELK